MQEETKKYLIAISLSMAGTSFAGEWQWNDNIHAMLTGQMGYYHVKTGYDSDRQNAEEQALYQWFCNWLNGMDFEHMSEMDGAKGIQTILSTKRYEYTAGGNAYYHVLIEGKGV